MKIKYAIYPTLLDAFSWYLKSEKEDAKQELINKINRVPTPRTPQQMKGILFNKMVDGEEIHEKELKEHGLDSLQIKYLVNQFNDILTGASRQVYLESQLGPYKLYGFADAIHGDIIYDIKTTNSYSYNKYYHGIQRLIYPYCLLKEKVDKFTYLVTDFKYIYREDYIYCNAEIILKSKLDHFAWFLEDNRHLITDKKIFV